MSDLEKLRKEFKVTRLEPEDPDVVRVRDDADIDRMRCEVCGVRIGDPHDGH